MKPIARLLIVLALPLLALVLPALAIADSSITVCVSGPPSCDYASIQTAIDAANSGDTVVVSAGTYTEQITLKSGVTLTSTDGPTSTIVTALASPIISGSNLVSVTLEGLGVIGSEVVTDLIGIDLLDSSVLLSNTIISRLHGANGTPVYTNGLSVIGLRTSGTFSVILSNSIIENIIGGDALLDSEGRGGNAIGVAAIGVGQLSAVSSSIRNLKGGTPGMGGDFMYCAGIAGHSLGIDLTGSASLSIERSTISGLAGGPPCRAQYSSYPCPNNAGSAIAIRASGGILTVDDSSITDNRVWASYQNAQAAGVVGSGLQSVAIKDTVISTFGVSAAELVLAAPASPFCTAGNTSAVAVSLDASQQVTLERNRTSDLRGFGIGGEASGFVVRNAPYITATGNQISHLAGGSIWIPDEAAATVHGIYIDTATRVMLTANQISNLLGDTGENIAYSFNSQGGAAIAIQIVTTTQASVNNNIIQLIQGGNGADNNWPGWVSDVQEGGNAVGLRIDDGSAWLQNNTVYDILGGEGGHPNGVAGQAAGFRLNDLLGAFVTNNALISTTVGVSATASNYLWDYNALWQTDLDYSGVVSGSHDLHVEPGFVDAEHGDFRLRFTSPLIDSGFNLFAPSDDFDGNSRPVDGNGDGLAVTDIGAYEYQPVPLHRHFLPVIIH